MQYGWRWVFSARLPPPREPSDADASCAVRWPASDDDDLLGSEPVRTVLLPWLLLLAYACGGDLRPPDDVPPEYGGQWPGLVSVTIDSDAPRTYEATLRLSVSGQMARVDGLCPDGTGSADMLSFDGVLGWAGEIECFPSLLNGCLVTLVYTSAAIHRTGDETMVVEAYGHAIRTSAVSTCGDTTTLRMTFTGTSRH